MDFISFIILLFVSIVVSGVLHFFLKFYIIPGWRSYFSKVLIGWVGAWLGSPVFGYWWQGLNYKEVYIIPAILGLFKILTFPSSPCFFNKIDFLSLAVWKLQKLFFTRKA